MKKILLFAIIAFFVTSQIQTTAKTLSANIASSSTSSGKPNTNTYIAPPPSYPSYVSSSSSNNVNDVPQNKYNVDSNVANNVPNDNILIASSNSQNTVSSFGSSQDLMALANINIRPSSNVQTPNSKSPTQRPNPQGSAQWISGATDCLTGNCPFTQWVMTFCLTCLESPITITLGVWPPTMFFAYIKNTLTGYIYVLPINFQGSIVVPTNIVQNLACGCYNQIYIIQMIPNGNGGAAWLCVYQSPKCYRCSGDSQGLTFFNPKTCRCSCRCLGDGSQCIGKNQIWSGYPKCSCTCKQMLNCSWNRPDFNYNTCECDCYKKCYPWQTLDWNNCTCI